MAIDPSLKSHPLHPAWMEFQAADVAYRRMVACGVGNFEEYELAWRELLGRIERVWAKTEAAVMAMPGWQKVKSDVTRLRRSDPLLIYLFQARNVDEHSIAPLAKEHDMNLQGKLTENGRVQLSWDPWDRPLLPVANRGVVYQPPRMHLGASIAPLLGKGKAEPRVVAELGMQFYINFLNRVSTEVVGQLT